MIGDKDSKEFKGEAEILWTYKKDLNMAVHYANWNPQNHPIIFA